MKTRVVLRQRPHLGSYVEGCPFLLTLFKGGEVPWLCHSAGGI